MNFEGAKDFILNQLQNHLNPLLYYHNLEHTLDVFHATTLLASSENLDPDNIKLLETAALFHDSGMIHQYKEHEEASAQLAKKHLPAFDFSPSETDTICQLILVTKLPQNARTLLEEIICDADLDYLGRSDYFIHSFKLKLEWKLFAVADLSLLEWFELQVNFLETHRYYTSSAKKLRDDRKRMNTEAIKSLVTR